MIKLSELWTAFMAHFDQNLASTQGIENKQKTKGGLTSWRERLVKEIILERLNESIEVAELASACSLTRSHFSRAFKRTTGVSPQAWIRQQRISKAKQLIQETHLSLTQISLDCGFSDQAHFCTTFIRNEGVTPLAWRRHFIHVAPSARMLHAR